MHLILHIFKKDVRRLWWGVAIALLIQAAAVWFDTDDLQVAGEFGTLLIVTWAALIALAVHEDPLVSDRQFWITRPARWRVLLGSKLLFAVAVVHVPSFLADVVLLAAHGFRPWEWLTSLFIKQLALAAFTLLTIAMAAVLPGFAHLALAVIAIAGLTSLASGFSTGLYSRWTSVEDIRMVLFGVVLTAVAVVIVPWQFARRRTWPSRFLGMAGVLVAELLLAFLSPLFIARVRAAVDPIPTNISFHIRTDAVDLRDAAKKTQPYSFAFRGSVGMMVPLTVAGVPEGISALFDLQVFDLVGPGDQRYQIRPTYNRAGLAGAANPPGTI